MDWFTWLSKTGLDPSVVYEYALTFTQNELGRDDVVYFSHEFLQSMGVSIAKHRLEILKLATKKKIKGSSISSIHPVLWFMFAVKQTKNYVAKQVQALVHRKSSRRLSVFPARNHSLRWKVAMLQRNRRLPPAKPDWPMLDHDHGILMLTNGSTVDGSRSSGSTESSVWVDSEAKAEAETKAGSGEAMGFNWNSSFSRTPIQSPDREYWSSSTDEIKWDSMFQNMNPT